jgi:hypothetical protein
MKDVSYYCPSSNIRTDAVIWGDQTKNGNTNSMFKIKKNSAYST